MIIRRVALATCALFVACLVPLVLCGSSSQGKAVRVNRPAHEVASPDGIWLLRVEGFVSGQRPAGLYLQRRDEAHQKEIIPLERDAWVLWRQDSKAVSITDSRYSNRSFLYVLTLGPKNTQELKDLTPSLESRVRETLDGKEDLIRFLVQAVRWLDGGRLLAIVYAEAVRQSESGATGYHRGFIVDPDDSRIVRELDEKEVRQEFGIDVRKVLF